jgi:Mu transposase, C-terminal domain
MLRSLPTRALPRREQRLRRRVALDALIDVDTVRYSVPHRLVGDHVDVVIAEQILQVFHGSVLVATHARSTEPFARVVDPAHHEGLWRRPAAVTDGAAPAALAVLGRDLAEYAALVAGGGQ